MKKLYLHYLLCLMPVSLFAQSQPPVLKDAWKRVPGISSSIKFNGNLGIIQVTLSDSSFELMAVNSKMAVLWRDSLKGCGVACGKFKGNILAISDSGYSGRKGNINPYYAFLIDPLSGKITLQNKIFEQKATHEELATAFFAPDGSDFNLVVKQADINHSWLSPYKNKIEDLTIVSLNEKLEPTFLKPKLPDEDFVSMVMNDSGDFFLMTINGHRSLQVRRYEHGSIQPSEPLTQSCDDTDLFDLWDAANGITPSGTDRNVLYLSIAHTNVDNDREIITAKFDFTTRQEKAIGEVFTHKHVREVEKNFVPLHGGFPDADLGSAKKAMRVQYIGTNNGELVTVSSEIYTVNLNKGTTCYGNALLINCYDTDLKQLFQQVMPVSYAAGIPLPTCYGLATNQLNIITNVDFGSVFGQLDLSSGKWIKLVSLTSDGAYADQHIIWLYDSIVVPYKNVRLFGRKCNIDLVLENY